MCFKGQPLHPVKHALQIFTDASKEGWDTHLNERKRVLVTGRKQAAYKLSGTKSSLPHVKGI